MALSMFLVASGAALYVFWRLQTPEQRLLFYRERFGGVPARFRPGEQDYDNLVLTVARWPFVMGLVFLIGALVRG